MKKYTLIFILLLAAIFSFKATDDYFEISKNLDIFASVYKEINLSYVDEVKPGELIRAAIDGMLTSLDPYTNFYSEAQAEDYRFQVTGTYAGIGASTRSIGKQVVIESPYDGFPAHKAGLLPGDVILEIDGKSMKNKSNAEVTEYLNGNAGTTLLLKIDRMGNGPMDIPVTRENIQFKNVNYYNIIDAGLGYILLSGFTPGAGKEVRDAVNELKSKGANGIILDLRGNGGGLLHEAINIVNVFIKKGETVVITKSRDKNENRTYKTLNQPVDTDIPLVVLIDGASASASEIVAGALQDLDRAVLLGQNSFGKGLVQGNRQLSYNTQIKITIAKYYIPSGRLIQRLDYAHKVNGKATAVADSLKQIFYTKNKREVTDGEGIAPDIEIEPAPLSKVSQSLLGNHHIFNFASLYRSKTENITEPLHYDISDEVFASFNSYLRDKEYAYHTDTEKLLEKLKESAKEEKMKDAMESSIQSLEQQIHNFKEDDVQRNKDEIKELLEYEIVKRYYFERGKIEVTFDDDPVLAKAMETVKNPLEINNILGN